MFDRFKILFLVMALTVVLASGCSDRGTNSSGLSSISGEVLVDNHIYYDELILQIRNPFQQFFVRIYVPEGSIIPMQGGKSADKIPLLVLLAPQGGDHSFFLNHSLKQLANEMIASGEIQPMAIACIPNDKTFGGFFYAGDHLGAGKYDQLIGGSLIDHLYSIMPYLKNDPSQIGIGGIGQGAYGAFRAAIKHSGRFNSISVVDGPLDFDGNGTTNGFVDLFDDALNEQITPSDPGGLLGDPDAFIKFDTTSFLARTFVGAALAFSPHDTAVVWDTTRHTEFGSGNETLNVEIVSTDTISDMTTFVPNVVDAGDAHNFDFHLPFDYDASPYPLIWNMWLDNNLENMLTNELDDVHMWVGTSVETAYGYHEQTMSFVGTLKASGLTVEVKNYVGYDPSYQATQNEYIFDILRDMLKFHSAKFGK